MPDENYKKGFSTALKIILGAVLLVNGLVAIYTFRAEVVTLFKASVGFIILLAGAITLAIAKD
jgi:hypothetical protein